MNRLSTPRAAKTVTKARIHKEAYSDTHGPVASDHSSPKRGVKKKAKSNESVGGGGDLSPPRLKDPPELSYDAVRLAEALKKKGTVETPKFNWRALGIQVDVCFCSLLPNVYFLHRPLECVCPTVDDDKERNEVVRGLDKDFEECEVVKAGVRYRQ